MSFEVTGMIVHHGADILASFDLKTLLLARHAQHMVLIHFPIALFRID